MIPHDDEDVVTPPTCTEAGYTTHTCRLCGRVLVDTPVSATGHSFATEFISDDTHHWHLATCGHDDAIVKEEHTLVNGVCSVCGVTPELEYSKIAGKEAYMVDGVSNDALTSISIPTLHDGLPITAISEYAFYGNTVVETVYVPDAITEIGSSAFKNCTALTSIRLPEGLLSIGDL